MRSSIIRNFRLGLVSSLALASAALCQYGPLDQLELGVVASASAQGLMGGGRGAGSGGTSGGIAGPRGDGSGGSTAGTNSSAGAGPGGTATSTGPGSVNQNRFGGAFPTPPDEPPVTPTASAVMTLLSSDKEQNGFGLPGRCGTHPINGLGPRERMAGQNLELLKAAQIYLAPDFDPGRESTGLYLIADYQEEIEKVRPDATLLGAYLALAATRSVTGDMVTRVNSILCVTATTVLVENVARNANVDRAGRK